MMAATLARGITILKNCAIEPEIASLGNFLIKSGAKIEGLDSYFKNSRWQITQGAKHWLQNFTRSD